ncbi:MAG: type pilus assembly protein PilM [Fibrobacteres bacterium]|nr:type pilus assembly protein PilM [Fibrobacterota bacterium]
MKRSIQTSKPGFAFGIEHDHRAIRAARLSSDGRGAYSVDRLEEVKGDFSEDGGLLEGFRKVKSLLNIGARESLIACLAGKQVFAAQVAFRKLGAEEMEQALRLELRKTVHFEVATSSLDFEILDDDEGVSNGGMAQVMVALASNSVLNRHLGILDKAGLNAIVVDVLPVAIANALWSWKGGQEGDYPLVALHVGPQVSTIVIDGEHSPFFNRNIYFAAEDVFGEKASPGDREKRIRSLAEEISRSLLFYEKNYQVSGFQEIIMLGDYLDQDQVSLQIRNSTGLQTGKMDLARQLGSLREPAPGRFDLAIALALRGDK